jgi:hypothetical protein
VGRHILCTLSIASHSFILVSLRPCDIVDWVFTGSACLCACVSPQVGSCPPSAHSIHLHTHQPSVPITLPACDHVESVGDQSTSRIGTAQASCLTRASACPPSSVAVSAPLLLLNSPSSSSVFSSLHTSRVEPETMLRLSQQHCKRRSREKRKGRRQTDRRRK